MPGLLKKAGYACVPVLVLFALGESAARLLGAGGIILYPNADNCQRRSALLGQEFRPHCTARVAGKAFRTNALGLRDDEVADDGRARILAIGDSCTFGWGVEQGEAYPQVLQTLLDASPHAGRFRVVNAGIPGYTSHHGRLYLDAQGRALHPAVVVASYGFNDIAPAGDARDALAAQRRLLPLLRLDDALIDSSRLWRWLRWMTIRPPAPTSPLRSTPAQYGGDLRAIVALAREMGAQPVLVDFLHERSPQVEHVAALRSAARDLDVPLVTYAGPRLDVVHPTREGYAAFAAELRWRLDAAGLLD